MAIVKRLTDYALRGGTGGYSVEGYDPRLTVGQVNRALSRRGEYSLGGMMDKSQERAIFDRISQAQDKEIATKMALSAAEAKAKRDAFESDAKAYADVLKALPEDKLGNKIMTPEAEALGARLRSHMMGEVGPRKTVDELKAETGFSSQEPFGLPATSVQDRGQQERGGLMGGGPRRIVTPVQGQRVRHVKGGEGSQTGRTRQGSQGTEFEILLDDGTKKWARQSDLEVVEGGDKPFSIEDYFRQKGEEAKLRERAATEEFMIP